MSRHTQRREVRRRELIDELSIAAAVRLKLDSDDIEHIITAAVDYLIEEYPAQDLYIPARSSTTHADIRAALQTGAGIREICRNLGVSRATVYRARRGLTCPMR